ncbi:hypothetical protein [Massilia sp. TWR1-2-2]|uniref:hypothetical protein n=1 Tax=Massilia sp. TWR1-2-2 TaxID=2804584 RepID=UPI003CF9C8A6
MITFESLPLTPDSARAARNYYGLNQMQAASDSGLPVHKIKRFETGNHIPDTKFLDDLRGFYESKGYAFADTMQPGAKARATGNVFPGGVVQGDGNPDDLPAVGKLVQSTVQHIRIDPTLGSDEIGNILDHIEHNEERVSEMLSKPVTKGLFSAFAEPSEAQHGQVLRLLAENGTLLAKLLGRPLPSASGSDPAKGVEASKTHAELLAKTQAQMSDAIKGDKAASAKHRSAKQPKTLIESIFG